MLPFAEIRRMLSALSLSLLAAGPIWAQTPPVVPVVPAPSPAPAPAPAVPAGYTGREKPDEPGAAWAPAASTNFTPANRPEQQPVEYVVIHDIEGTAVGAVRWFQNPRSRVSAHYVVDAVEGRVWQQVLEKDIGWHAGNWNMNTRSIGIEHEGYAYRPGYYTPTLYEASARLVRNITSRWNIPRDRSHIIAHAEVPHPREEGKFGGAGAHTDPGPYWNWSYFMTLVRNDAQIELAPAVINLHPGEQQTLEVPFVNLGDDPWPANLTGRHNPAVEEQGPVYLGVADLSPSPLSGPGWVSPRLAAFPRGGEVVPGATGIFTLTLNGPRKLETLQQSFRLVKVPIMPDQPVPFGPVWSVTVTVTPWELEWKTDLPGFSAPFWFQKQDEGRRIYWRKQGESASPRAEAAVWKAGLPLSGDWEVYARWTGGPARTGKAAYTLETAAGKTTVTLDQRKQAGEWVKLGRFPIPEPGMVTVRLEPGSPGIVVADSLRFVGPFPASSR